MGKVDCGFRGGGERERECGVMCVMIERMSGWE
jgi:hypothetical protein